MATGTCPHFHRQRELLIWFSVGSSHATERVPRPSRLSGKTRRRVDSCLSYCPTSRAKSNDSACVEKIEPSHGYDGGDSGGSSYFKGITCDCVMLLPGHFQCISSVFPVYKCQLMEKEKGPQSRAFSSILSTGTFASPSALVGPTTGMARPDCWFERPRSGPDTKDILPMNWGPTVIQTHML